MEVNGLVRSSTNMALGTVVARITGLIRGLLIVALLGTALLGDTFNVANTMPNILFNLLVGGALTSVFMPQIVQSLRDDDGGQEFISKLYSVSIYFLLIITVVGVIFSPFLVKLYAPQFFGRPEFEITVTLMRFCLPQVFFLGLFAILGQIANAKNKFGPMMWAPVLNNVASILFLSWLLKIQGKLLLSTISNIDLVVIGLGTTFAYSLQALILYPVILKSGLKLKLTFKIKDSRIIKSLRLASWSFLYATISQVSFLVTVIISTSAAVNSSELGNSTGVGFTPYANAYLILLVPHSIITVSVVTAMLPQLSNFVIDKQFESFNNLLNISIKMVGIFVVPAALLFLSFGTLITDSIFIGISYSDANYLGRVLAAFSLGLIPVSVNLILLRAFNAFEDIKTPVVINLVMNLISIILSIIVGFYIDPYWVTFGLALIFTFHYFIGISISSVLLRRHKIDLQLKKIIVFYLKIVVISLISLSLVWFLRDEIPGRNIVKLAIVIAIDILSFALVAKLFRVREVNLLLRFFVTRKGTLYK